MGGCQFHARTRQRSVVGVQLLQPRSSAQARRAGQREPSACPITVHVVDGQDGEPLPGPRSAKSSTARPPRSREAPSPTRVAMQHVTLTHAGAITLKATRAAAVRSNGAVGVHNGNDGTCGTTRSARSSPTKRRSSASKTATSTGATRARVLQRGAVTIPAGGTLRDIRIRLRTHDGGHCFNFNGSGDRVRPSQKVRHRVVLLRRQPQSFSYLLPARLPAGRLRLSEIGGRSTQPGRSRSPPAESSRRRLSCRVGAAGAWPGRSPRPCQPR